MADLAQLERALINADAAGDTAAAQALAGEIRRMRGAGTAQAALKETSFLSGLVQGFRDPIDAGAQLLEQGVKAVAPGVAGAINRASSALGMAGSADEARKTAAQGIESTLGAPGTGGRILGNVLASAPAAAALPATAATVPGMAAQGAATGGLFSLLQPVESGDFWKEKGKQVATGAVTGGLLTPAVAGMARVAMPQAAQRAGTLLDEGVTPTPGQLLGGAWRTAEDKLSSVPVLGDVVNNARRKAVEEMNRAVYSRALSPIGGEVPRNVGREGVAAVKDQLGSAYDDLLPQMRFVADPQFNSEISSLTQMVSTLPRREARQFEQIMARELQGRMTPGGVISGETLKTIQSQLGSEAKQFSSAQDAYQQKLGQALREAGESFRRGIERSNPQLSERLGEINSGYANYATLRNAASRSGSREGVVTPAQLAAAVRSQDRSVGKGAFATGRARMQDLADEAVGVLGTGYPDSGTAGRLMFAAGIPAMAAVSPATAALGAAATLPYMPVGRQMAAALLARRPEGAEAVAQGIRRSAGPAALLAPALGQPLLD